MPRVRKAGDEQQPLLFQRRDDRRRKGREQPQREGAEEENLQRQNQACHR